MSTQAENEASALEKCDSMAFHMPGTIQPFGCLIGLDLACTVIVYASQNVDAYLGFSAQTILDMDPREVLDPDLLHTLRNISGRTAARTQRMMAGMFQRDEGIASILTCHVRDETLIVEFTRQGTSVIPTHQGLDRLRWLTTQFVPSMTVPELLNKAVAPLRAFSGYQRVMAYRFRPDGSGEVVAEDKDPRMESLLGLRFPAYDVPPRVKTLYQKTPIRIIHDVDAVQVGMVRRPGAPELDMSLAVLRGTMPQHTDYLRNMGVQATLSLPLVIKGKLWGLMTFHSLEPRFLEGGDDLTIEFAGQYLTLLINTALESDLDRLELVFVKTTSALYLHRNALQPATLAWNSIKHSLMNSLPACGVAAYLPGGTLEEGICPPVKRLKEIHDHLVEVEPGLRMSDSLALDMPGIDLNGVAGVLSVQVGEVEVMFFRKTSAATVAWAGKPGKTLSQDADGGWAMTPRGSFAAYQEVTKGRADSWETRDQEIANGLRRGLMRAQTDAVERDVLFDNLQLVVQELNHRVRNILALVQSIVQQSRPVGAEAALHFDQLEARILSLANAHNLLSDSGDTSIDLESALQREAKPFDGAAVQLDGPKLGIAARGASIFVLVLHEMFSNAAKFGALSQAGGVVSVSWHLTQKGLTLTWRERGGPPVETPVQTGFGSLLINNAFAFEFEGDSTVEYAPSGLNVTLFVPNDVVVLPLSKTQIPAAPQEGLVNLAARHRDPIGTVLVLESDFMIAAQIKTELEDQGAQQVFMVSNNADALRLIGTQQIDIALLDINLEGARSTATAKVLQDRGIPFMFVTGCDEVNETIRGFPQAIVVQKPFDDKDLIAKLRRVLGRGQDV